MSWQANPAICDLDSQSASACDKLHPREPMPAFVFPTLLALFAVALLLVVSRILVMSHIGSSPPALSFVPACSTLPLVPATNLLSQTFPLFRILTPTLIPRSAQSRTPSPGHLCPDPVGFTLTFLRVEQRVDISNHTGHLHRPIPPETVLLALRFTLSRHQLRRNWALARRC